MATLRIGIDARAAAEVPAGSGRVVRELLRALGERNDPHRYVCYARQPWEAGLDERFQWRLIGLPDPWWHARTAWAAQRECDVFLAANSFLTVLLLRLPAVPIVYDLVTFDRALRAKRRSLIVERLTLGRAVKRSAGIIAISRATEEALVARFPQAAGRVTVAPLGVSPAIAPDGSVDEPEGFVLAVGTLEPRKNLPRLVAAYARLPEDLQRRHRLVVAGKLGWETGPTVDALRSLGDRCRILGYVSDAALAELYQLCAVFCFPSLGEGFGLPVLEAMSRGAAVLTSANTSLPEVGGDAVEYVDALDVASIAGGLERLLRSPERRAELGARGRERAQAFSWTRTAELTLGALEQAARGG
ncbi:MAG TPA: glycosyltransferase family 1 protein [Solirubrobacteraceae bacterium]|nr:glycosyltransferase family 1 protein [Solirubrobacteraceae bacterium]